MGIFSKKDKEESQPFEKLHSNPAESTMVNTITNNQQNAESSREGNDYDGTLGIDDIWEDEYKIYSGGGQQWSTNFAYRSPETRKIRPNSEDNFVFLAVENIVSNITINTPENRVEAQEDNDKEIAEKINHALSFNDKKNNFRPLWREWVRDFVAYGPVIGMVPWDPEWMGGSGPKRWIGDVRLIRVNRKEFFPDPAIIDLENRLQECEYIHRKIRKKVSYIKNRWPERGKFVSEEVNTDELQYEGSDPKQCYLIESWQRGLPEKELITPKIKKSFMDRAAEAEADGDSYKAQEYRDMAEGKLEGIHCCYIANGVFLEYKPYVYDDGKYPFVFKGLYADENSQWPFGEIRNAKIPQIMHNKADEIEMEAMSREGLGGGYYSNGAIDDRQLEEITKKNGKGGVWLKVNDINQMKEREGVKVPASIVNYKEHKQRMVETLTQNTNIYQGNAPAGNMPYKAIAELGARTDVRTKMKVEILQDFLIEINRLRISRFVQFYKQDRFYTIQGQNGETISGTINSNDLRRSWIRNRKPKVDEFNNPVLDANNNQEFEDVMEYFVPEFDVNVKIMDERPKSRDYYTQTAFNLVSIGAMTIQDLWYTLDEGKFPPKEDVMEHLEQQNQALQIANYLQQIPPEAQQQFMMSLQQSIQAVTQMPQQQQFMQQQAQYPENDMDIDPIYQNQEMMGGGINEG